MAVLVTLLSQYKQTKGKHKLQYLKCPQGIKIMLIVYTLHIRHFEINFLAISLSSSNVSINFLGMRNTGLRSNKFNFIVPIAKISEFVGEKQMKWGNFGKWRKGRF